MKVDKKWKEEFEDTISFAFNGYFKSDKYKLEKLFEMYFGLQDDCGLYTLSKVKIKAKKGKIVIEEIE